MRQERDAVVIDGRGLEGGIPFPIQPGDPWERRELSQWGSGGDEFGEFCLS